MLPSGGCVIGAVVFDAGELSDSTPLAERGKTPVIRRMRMACAPWPLGAYAVPIVLVWGEASRPGTCCAGSKGRPGQSPVLGDALFVTAGHDR